MSSICFYMKHFIFFYLFISLCLLLFSCRFIPSLSKRTKINQKSKTDKTCLIDKLQNGDTLFVNQVSQGCFHFREDFLYINKSKDSLFCSFYKEISRDSWVARKHIRFTSNARLLYCKFQSKLQSIKNSRKFRCTTTSIYKIILKEVEIEVKHDDCSSSDGWVEFKNELNSLK